MPDLRIGLLFLTVETLTLSVLLLVVWLNSRRSSFYLYWSIGFAFRTAGIIALAINSQTPGLLPVEFPNALTLWSISFWLVGMHKLSGRAVPPNILFPVAVWLIGMQLPGAHDNLVYRAALYGVSMAGGCVMLAWSSLSIPVGRTVQRHIISGLWIMFAVNAAVVSVCVAIEQPADILDLSVGPLCGGIGAAGLIAMVVTWASIVMDMSQTRLRHLASSDPLTGALNRRGLEEAFAPMLEHGRHVPLVAILVFDLDHFKQINDLHSHDAGDQVLTSFATLARDAIGDRGIFARSGGEEFVAAIPVSGHHEAVAHAEAIRMRFGSTHHQTKSGTIRATVSIGIALMPNDEADVSDLMHAADAALYEAKARGRNRCAVLHDGAVHVVRREAGEDTVANDPGGPEFGLDAKERPPLRPPVLQAG
ncbi:GGDEF domain-containing protein [Rhizobium sp. NRK18]|uniref:GGDEF domain-containing protein n=1 Tax=Rhizobium sp. NRK18 TaxID=2964667 RepID=UPI0021C36102|nr:GGDEF domain-containing protein [Rhizobium sp. NRK18]MCQ2004606.1 GGDEF domain-containing protein [Rhizobium sp. NRK18]